MFVFIDGSKLCGIKKKPYYYQFLRVSGNEESQIPSM